MAKKSGENSITDKNNVKNFANLSEELEKKDKK